jgi:hypothetical protein
VGERASARLYAKVPRATRCTAPLCYVVRVGPLSDHDITLTQLADVRSSATVCWKELAGSSDVWDCAVFVFGGMRTGSDNHATHALCIVCENADICYSIPTVALPAESLSSVLTTEQPLGRCCSW